MRDNDVVISLPTRVFTRSHANLYDGQANSFDDISSHEICAKFSHSAKKIHCRPYLVIV